jgi:hypothetical protein
MECLDPRQALDQTPTPLPRCPVAPIYDDRGADCQKAPALFVHGGFHLGGNVSEHGGDEAGMLGALLDSPAMFMSISRRRRRSLLSPVGLPNPTAGKCEPVCLRWRRAIPIRPRLPVRQMLFMPPGEALTSHYPKSWGVDQSCQSVLRHERMFVKRRYAVVVPRLSAFYGIVIYLYWDDHNPPH